MKKLSMLPFTSDTNATKARRSQCEFKLKEIEFDISRLSLPKVFYPINN
jgi:Calmodulin-binding